MGSSGKTDMDRIGLFKEMEYVTIKDPYKEASRCELVLFLNSNKISIYFSFLKLISMKQRIRISK